MWICPRSELYCTLVVDCLHPIHCDDLRSDVPCGLTSTTLASFQSIACDSWAACSAIVEWARFLLVSALLCSFKRWSNVQPVWAHTPWDRCPRGCCRLHLSVVGVGCGPSGSAVPAVGCDVGESRSESPVELGSVGWAQTVWDDDRDFGCGWF